MTTTTSLPRPPVIPAMLLAIPAFVLVLNLGPSLAATPDLSLVPRVLAISPGGAVRASCPSEVTPLVVGQTLGNWTLMAVLPGKQRLPLAVFEDFTRPDGHLLFVSQRGVMADFPKTLESVVAEPATLYRGHTLQQVFQSQRDVLAEEILAQPRDPEYL